MYLEKLPPVLLVHNIIHRNVNAADAKRGYPLLQNCATQMTTGSYN